jgi:DHA1 family multidrug resistance protein-like MFS transporter
MMAMAGVSMSASFLTPLLLRWLGKARVLALSHLAYLLALLALLCSSGPEGGLSWLLAGCALVCIGFSCGFGVAMGEALDVCGDQVASASALLCIMQIGLSGLFIWGMGHLGMPALWMLILALLLALLGYLVVKVLLPWRAIRRVRARG